MNVLPTATLGHPRSSIGSVGNASAVTSNSPNSTKSRGRKRTQDTAGFESSPGSVEDGFDDNGERRRQPGVKRACNDCRQQKVSH